ncbi:choice-of-anchor L domain-containing protein, partial [uncultured Lacinutrix sp.]|uniref:choice-of-anchor L domain-containing protein n=1 Tax=uncultured Lacinutrix sp. TaxID=574032 RepID=UPI0026077406
MKNYYLLFIFLFSFSFIQGQIITVNDAANPESSLGPEQLVSDVLISGGCAGVDNFTFQVNGSATDLTTKSYGYFDRGANTGFPFERGIILTTGQAAAAGNVVNPTIISNINGQAGDTDLEVALGQTNTNDATFIKFNFTPTGNDISFRYLMTSEEYDGATECNFTDSFAFLLREVGSAVYTNLAVLPDGTPVSVVNINNAAACNANTAFFEGYNIGDTNYGGRTVVLTASATVIPNTVYEIKLVVADQGDSALDSAIFLEAGSFNLGGDLGPDVTINSGTAKCIGETLTLNTQTDPAVAHTWFFNGTEITGETGPTIDVTQAGTYSVDVNFGANCVTMDSIEVEFIQPGVVNNVNNLIECNNTGGAVVFDLTENTPEVLGTQDPANFNVSYHNSQVDADMDANIIANPTMYNGTDGEMIYVRIEDGLSGLTGNCYDTDVFTLQYLNIVINTTANLEICDDITNDGFEAFNLESQTASILGAQLATDYTVTYHVDFANADANTNALTSPYTNIVNSQPIFVRIQSNQDPACYVASATAAFNLIVNPTPVLPVTISDYGVCDNATDGDDTNGFTEFDLTTQ